MNIKYLFGDDNNYMNFTIDVTAKTLTGAYVRNTIPVIEETIDISPVLDLSSPRLPKVELAKRGFVWDFRLSKQDANDKVVRKTLSILADFLLAPTSVEFSNATGVNRTLKDLISYPLSAYDSPMTVKQKLFTDDNGVAGESTNLTLSPVITANGLLIGKSANLSVTLSPTPITATTDEMYFSLKFGELPIMSTNTRTIEFQVGGNLITIMGAELYVNGSNVCGLHSMLSQHRIVFRKDQCIIGGKSYPCNWVDSDYTHVLIKGDANTEVFALQDITVQAVENFFEDSVPPASISQLVSVAGDKEVFLKWKPNTEDDLAGYNVYVNGVKHNLALLTDTDYQVTSLTNGIEYLVTVTAVDKSGNEAIPVESLKIISVSDASKEVSDITIDSTAAGVSFKYTTPTYVDFDKICIYQQDMANMGLTKVAELPYNQNEFVLTPLPSEGKYMFIITTVSLSGEETSGVQMYHFVNYDV